MEPFGVNEKNWSEDEKERVSKFLPKTFPFLSLKTNSIYPFLTHLIDFQVLEI